MRLYDDCRTLGYCECGGCEAMYKRYRRGGLSAERTRAGSFTTEEEYRAWRKKIGAKGGSAPYKGKKGFAAMTPEQRAEAGRKGGSVKK